ncbi:hypothetical protein [Arthrobacter rhombi]|uniref:hypothetical protein n=1 Tax=Arthrobacter rhombi TaxID=71253 RepID=UPI003FD02C0E
MPEILTASEYKNEIIAAVPGVNHNFAARCAKRMKRTAENRAEQFDFYESLRILGIVTDNTARDAVANLEVVAA